MPDLKEQLTKLASLAETEKKILELSHQIEVIPQKLKELQLSANDIEKSFNEKKAEFDNLESEHRRLSAELTDSQEKIKSRETRLFEIKTNKEYQASIKEISETKKINLDLENTLLKKMEEIEILKQELPKTEEGLNALKTQIGEEESHISGDLSQINSQLEEKLELKKQALATLEKRIINQYQRILSKRNPAIAAAVGGTCQECNINVPPQLYIELQKFREIINCPSCHRILYLSQTIEPKP